MGIPRGSRAGDTAMALEGEAEGVMSDAMPIVFVVDDDAAVRKSVERLLLSAGLRSEAFGSPQQFLARPRTFAPCCLVLDVNLPGLNGLELQARLAAEHREIATIFVTGCRDVAITVQAMKAGALDFLTKPFNAGDLLRAVRDAIASSRVRLAREEELQPLRQRYESLTPREQEVMALVVSGHLNREVAGELGITEITVKAHRGRLMRKMHANSLPHLVDMAARLDHSLPAYS
jgi:FixJ family two-component response regulator